MLDSISRRSFVLVRQTTTRLNPETTNATDPSSFSPPRFRAFPSFRSRSACVATQPDRLVRSRLSFPSRCYPSLLPWLSLPTTSKHDYLQLARSLHPWGNYTHSCSPGYCKSTSYRSAKTTTTIDSDCSQFPLYHFQAPQSTLSPSPSSLTVSLHAHPQDGTLQASPHDRRLVARESSES